MTRREFAQAIALLALSVPTFGKETKSRKWVTSSSERVVDACEEIIGRLIETYGKPTVWRPFPVYYRSYQGNGVAGYTLYTGGKVTEVVIYEPFEKSLGGTLDHEITHAFYFYLLDSNFDLCLNEGIAQNSEYRRREALRQTVYRRYKNGEFWELTKLIGRNQYDGSLLIYHQGFSVVDFLTAKGGSIWFTEFMRDFTHNGNINKSLSRFYDYDSLEEFESDWKHYIAGGQNTTSVESLLGR